MFGPFSNSISPFLGVLRSTVVVFGLLLTAVIALRPATAMANACPFCQAINLTFTEQLASKDIAIVAKLLELPKPISEIDDEADLPKAAMEIVKVLKGGEFVKAGMKFNVVVVGTYPVGQEFLVMGVNPPNVSWTTPMKASDRVFAYLEKLNTLPEKGADRLAFFQKYFEDEESILAFDAYDEFARAPYEDLLELKDRMPKDKLIAWVKDPELSHNRRRLYLTMLGVCGGAEEAKVLGEFIASDDRQQQAGLDALIASYLTLKGSEGLPLIVDSFLTNQETEYVDVLAAVSALRFHGTEVDVIPKPKVIAAVRHVLDRPRMADMVIPDLARWEDWSVMDRLVKMFKEADDETNWMRVPVISYLQVCPLPAAKTHIEELTKIDPDAVRRAEMFAHSLDGFGDEDDSDDEELKPDADQETPAPAIEDVDSTGLMPQRNRSSKLHFVSTNEPTRERDVSTSTASPEKHTVFKPAIEPQPNQNEPASVATMANPEPVEPNADQVAKSFPGAAQLPVAAVSSTPNVTRLIVFVPMGVSALIFVVLWSVVSGWFERLIF